jgi:uncharacterized phiE125 gp8 family phage protein
MYTTEIIKKQPNVIPLNLLKQYLRIDNDDDNEIIEISLEFAQYYTQNIANIIISPVTYLITTNEITQNNTINIKEKPIISVDEIKLNTIILKTTEYKIHKNHIELLTNKTGTFEITTQCGHNAIENLPTELKTAILIHTAHHYANRTGENQKVPPMVDLLLSKFKPIKI